MSKRKRFTNRIVENLCSAKINQTKMPVGIKEDILRFEITMDNALSLEVFEGEKKFGSIKPGAVFRKGAKSRNVLKHFTVGTVFKDKVKELLVLSSEFKFDDTWMIQGSKQLLFSENILGFALSHDSDFIEQLDSIDLVVQIGFVG